MSAEGSTPDDRATEGHATLSERVAEVAAHFDDRATTYDSARMAEWYRAQGRLVLEELAEVTGPVVDVGCGTGWLLHRLLEEHPSATALGIDVSGRMIEVARRRARQVGSGRLSFLQADWEDRRTVARIQEHLPCPVSLVLCVSAFHYFHDPGIAARRMHDLLVPGGRLLLLDRAREGSVLTAIWDRLHQRLIRDHVRFFRTDELIGILEAAGFVSIEEISRIRRMLWKGKLATSLVLLSARRPQIEQPRPRGR